LSCVKEDENGNPSGRELKHMEVKMKMDWVQM
jgi:hypothetical protein